MLLEEQHVPNRPSPHWLWRQFHSISGPLTDVAYLGQLVAVQQPLLLWRVRPTAQGWQIRGTLGPWLDFPRSKEQVCNQAKCWNRGTDQEHILPPGESDSRVGKQAHYSWSSKSWNGSKAVCNPHEYACILWGDIKMVDVEPWHSETVKACGTN